MTDSLDVLLTRHYASEAPPPAFEAALLAMARDAGALPMATVPLRPTWTVWRALAAVLLVGAIGLATAPWVQSGLIVAEVRGGHAKAQLPTRLSAAWGEAVSDLGVSFEGVRPEALASLDLVGARKCSILGAPAILATFQDDAGGRWSLYQAPAAGRLGLVAGTHRSGAAPVRVWTEGGFLMGLVGPTLPGDSP